MEGALYPQQAEVPDLLCRGGASIAAEAALAVRARTLRGAVRKLLQAEGVAICDREIQLLLARLSDAMLEGIAICDRAGRIVYANDYLCRMLGRSADELLYQPARAWFGEEFGAERYEVDLAPKTGAALVVEVSSRPIHAQGAGGRGLGWFAVLMDVTARAAAQAALRRSESDLRLLSAQLWEAQEHERRRIARELHDGIGQALGGIKFGLENCGVLMAMGCAAAAVDQVRDLTDKLQAVLEEVRRISMDLRPATLDDLGILATLGWFSREFRSLYRNVNLDMIVDVGEDEIPPGAKTAIYRIAQEALNNVVTHACARNVTLSIASRRGHIELVIEDDGSGFEPEKYGTPDDKARGLGLTSMRERAEASGGRFRLDSGPGRGTVVAASWPRRKEM